MDNKQDKDQEVSEQSECFEEESVIHKVKTVSDGSSHKHIWLPDWQDDEGKQHFQCSKCMQGIYRPIKAKNGRK